MRLASFNVENLFDRAMVFSPTTPSAVAAPLLDAFATISRLLQNRTYTPADQAEIVRLLGVLGLSASDDGELFRLRQNRGRLVRRSRDGEVTVVADGRADWIGWVESKRGAVTDRAVQHTARVVHDVGADVLCVVEAEDRWALRHFNADLVAPLGDGRTRTSCSSTATMSGASTSAS